MGLNCTRSPVVDITRITSETRSTEPTKEKDMDETTIVEEPIYVHFDDYDERNPIQFTLKRKWAMTILSSYATFFASSTASGYSLGTESMCRDLSCTRFQAAIGISVYTLGFGVLPLISASLSEEFGRQPMYYASAAGYLGMYILIALAPNIETVLVARFIQGACGSTWATMVAGTIADIWTPEQRGLPMALFAFGALGGTGFGPSISGWIEMNERLQWKWTEWIFMILCGVYILLLPAIMKETRPAILLRRIAQETRKETGNSRYRARVEDTPVDLGRMILLSCMKPCQLLFTEPIVLSVSIWVGFAWGVVFALILSMPLVFENLHHFNLGQTGSTFTALVVGCLLGGIANTHQERLYRSKVTRKGPEARLYSACVAAIFLPVGIFIYAWSSFPFVHWFVPIVGITLLTWATYTIFLAVFSYLADIYGSYASSALAGQSLCRNLTATAFPLFTTQMYTTMGYTWASTLLACVASAMIPIPFILFICGPRIRSRSALASKVADDDKTKRNDLPSDEP